MIDQLIECAAKNLINSKYAIALTGAGISTESGIPDFRGPSGIWTKNPEAERKAYQNYERFIVDPKGWWLERLTTRDLLGDLEQIQPNAGHLALVELENLGILKCVITQNIDGIHEKAGTSRLLEYHGSILKLRCISCNSRFTIGDYDLQKLLENGMLPPHCLKCNGIVKTDGVAFGEPIPSDVAGDSLEEALKCDVMLICGTSAVVFPFADLPRVARARTIEGGYRTDADISAVDNLPAVIIIEVNAEPTPLTDEGISDYLIQGKTGEVLPGIVEQVKRLKP
ncbi:NAD-dependent deacetylase [Chloroflexota bacterium]